MPKFFLYILSFSFFINTAFAVDTVKMALNDREMSDYKKALITQILEKTKPLYGSYNLNVHLVNINQDRHLIELSSGELINIAFQLTTNKAENTSIPIKIPMDKGVRNYRLLLTHQDNVEKMSSINSIDELKNYKSGLLYSWVTTSIFRHHQFTIQELPTYEGMFKLLSAKRIDYTVRGVNEIYNELDLVTPVISNLAVVPGIALYINSPSYIFVSKRFPRLAKRIKTGLELMIKDGSLDQLINQYFKKYLDKAQLSSRKIITIDNPFLPLKTPLQRKELWFDVTSIPAPK